MSLILIQTFLKNRDPPLGYHNSQIEIGNFRLFFSTPPPLGICPKFSRFFLVTPPLIKFVFKKILGQENNGSKKICPKIIFGPKNFCTPKNLGLKKCEDQKMCPIIKDNKNKGPKKN